jgi:excinuclease ABC subunit A
MADKIIIKGAREHNLKNINLTIPRDKLVVMTGLSGSGKSSLAFDTIYAEGQRRYVESLSAYARQFLGQMSKPDVDHIDGLSPAISIDQKSASKNPRSTVGTITEIYDYLRLLYARVGVPHCYKCGKKIKKQTAEQIIDQILTLKKGTKFQVLAPVIRGRKGEYQKLFEEAKREGFTRLRVDGKVVSVEEPVKLKRYQAHDIDIVVDRLVMKEGLRKRLASSVELALKLADGVVSIDLSDNGKNEELTFSEQFACLDCGVNYEELAPRMFSFNSPYGACPNCSGLGLQKVVQESLIIPDDSLSIDEGAIVPFSSTRVNYYPSVIKAVCEHYNISTSKPWRELGKEEKELILYGTDEPVYVKYRSLTGRMRAYHTPFEGVINNMERRYKESDSDYARTKLEDYMMVLPCPKCKGARLKKESLAVTFGNKNIYELCCLTSKQALDFFDKLKLSKRDTSIAERIIKEIKERLNFMVDVGLDYITLGRATATLSGGEAQRIRLATQIGSGLMGVLYILDEPSIGLHQRDNQRLIKTLKRLRDLGNTVIVVEHDEETIREADYVVDIGPGAGAHGGEVVVCGTVKKVENNSRSLTGKYLSGKLEIPLPAERKSGNGNKITIKKAAHHNLKNIDVDIPLGKLVCITGVSGSGKSTLIVDILSAALYKHFYHSKAMPGTHKAIEGLENIDKIIEIDQSPIGRTPRSNPATYTGTFDEIRKIFAASPEAKIRGYLPGRFSFNVKGGRCEACHGDGTIRIEMHFLPDIFIPCEVCKGKRYNRETLEVKYKGKNISEVLSMTVEEALDFFKNIPKIQRKLQTIYDVGLSYVELGQPAPTLSGGEAQRVKLSTELSKRSTGRTFYILDEPTTGLHFDDIKKLLEVLHRLTAEGNTVVVIEHSLDVIKCADHIIDLGPEGGDKGGYIVAEGTPEEIVKVKNSYTGKFLKKALFL